MARTILRRKAVEELTGKGRSVIYADIKLGRFPRPIRIGSGTARNTAVGWFQDEIEAWLAARAAERDGEVA